MSFFLACTLNHAALASRAERSSSLSVPLTHPISHYPLLAAHAILTSRGNTIHRFVNDGDMVPALPGEKGKFMHIGDGLEMNEGNCISYVDIP